MFNKITLGPITVYMYGLMIAIGFASALFLCNYRGKKRGLNEDTIFGIFLCALLGGMVGCRLLYYIVELPAIIVTSYVYCRIKKENFISYFDLVMPAVSMAQGFGRIGCFCAGCCYGRETDAWYGITFTHSDFAPNGVSLIPTQLISSAGDFLICGVLLWYASKKPEPGRVAAGYLVLYGVGRFLIEFLRNDYRGSLGIFSTSQIISFGIVALGIVMYFVIPKMMEKKE